MNIFNSLKTKLLFSIILLILIGMVFLFYFTSIALKSEVTISQKNVFSQRIDNIIFIIDEKYNILKDTGMEAALEDSFKEGTKNILRKINKSQKSDLLPFVINEKNEYIIPILKNSSISDKKIDESIDVFEKITTLKEGNIFYTINGKDHWIMFKHFEPWNWIIGFDISHNYMYKELYAFETRFFYIVFLILLFVSIFIILIIKYMLSPINELTQVSKQIAKGNLDTIIDTSGSDELHILARNFKIMRDKIKKNMLFLKNHNNLLEVKVKKRTAELEDSNYELETTIDNLKQTQSKLIESEKMASLGGLVAGIAHELNTPIGISVTAITHFSDITKEINDTYKKDLLTKETLEEYLETSSELVNMILLNLNKTIHLIVSFKKVSVDQTNEERREFNLKEYIDDILLSISNITKKTKIQIILDIDNNLCITSYPGAFSQIISNLIINSIKHGYAKNKKGIIGIKIIKENNLLILIYTDDGSGIKKEILHKIFDPFFTTNREHGGTGLGLNIIYNIIANNLNGEIVCKSKNGKGVEFTITLPISKKEIVQHSLSTSSIS